jgi:NDP-sugar pyrophosphorylase family protein
MNILILMAGMGSRFQNEGYKKPKPLINVNGQPMIEAAIKSLSVKGNYIFITRKYENESYNEELNDTLKEFTAPENIINIDYVTEGAVCSALLAKNLINNNESLIVTNCDQIMEWKGNEFSDHLQHSDSDAIVVTYPENTPKNSYIKINSDGYGVEVAEKRVISEHSLNGIHYFKYGKDFVWAGEKMIADNERVNNEFYIAPSLNQLIKIGKKVSIFEVEKSQHWSLGVPEDLNRYLSNRSEKI